MAADRAVSRLPCVALTPSFPLMPTRRGPLRIGLQAISGDFPVIARSSHQEWTETVCAGWPPSSLMAAWISLMYLLTRV